MFGGIERGVFTAAILGGKHYNLFSDGEVQQFTTAANNSDLFKPIRSACQRVGGWVLWAVYSTLLSTRDAPGAVQHASIASKLQECVTQSLGECDPVYFISGTGACDSEVSMVQYIYIYIYIYIHYACFLCLTNPSALG